TSNNQVSRRIRAAIVLLGLRVRRQRLFLRSRVVGRFLAIRAVGGRAARAACADRYVGGESLDEQLTVGRVRRGVADVADLVEVRVVLVTGRLVLALLAVGDERAVVLAVEVAIGILVGVGAVAGRVVVGIAGRIEAIAVGVANAVSVRIFLVWIGDERTVVREVVGTVAVLVLVLAGVSIVVGVALAVEEIEVRIVSAHHRVRVVRAAVMLVVGAVPVRVVHLSGRDICRCQRRAEVRDRARFRFDLRVADIL